MGEPEEARHPSALELEVEGEMVQMFPQFGAHLSESVRRATQMHPAPGNLSPDAYKTLLINCCVDWLSSLGPEFQDSDFAPPVQEPVDQPQDPPLPPEETVKIIKDMFPQVETQWMESKAADGWSVQRLADHIMDGRNNVPKISKKKRSAENEAPGKKRLKNYDYFVEWEGDNTDAVYRTNAEAVLCAKFPFISTVSLRAAFRVFRYHYAPTFKYLGELSSTLPSTSRDSRKQPVQLPPPEIAHKCGGRRCHNLQMLKKKRNARVPESLPTDLKAEIEWTDDKLGNVPVQPLSPSSSFECPICFETVLFTSCLSCSEGHLFCGVCVKMQTETVAYGQGVSQLKCLDYDCQAVFNLDVLKTVVDEEVLNKLEERWREEEINAADIENFERCKHCNWGAILEQSKEEDKVFRCGNEECQMEVCRKCGQDWDTGHMGVPCEEMESDLAIKTRREYEERMAKAVIRRCHRCHVPLMKQDGCNKMTCRCGAKMCYLCRKPDIDYNHFCKHVRNPGARCTTCTDCFLWDDAAKRDEKAVESIENEAKQDARLAEKASGPCVETEPEVLVVEEAERADAEAEAAAVEAVVAPNFFEPNEFLPQELWYQHPPPMFVPPPPPPPIPPYQYFPNFPQPPNDFQNFNFPPDFRFPPNYNFR